MQDRDERLIPFLRDLATSIEENQLEPQQLQRIGEFFMAYQFQEQAVQDMDNSETPGLEFSQEDLLKFLTLGWYVYQVLLRQDTLVEEELD